MGPFIEENAFRIELTGILIAFIGWFWILVRAFRHSTRWGLWILVFPPLAVVFSLRHWTIARIPFLLLLLGCLITAVPPVFVGLAPIDLGPREKMVDGERHLTLTGWDRKDYALLGSKRDAAVLQMANGDVTDATLANLKGMDNLKELDLNRTQITDVGLEIIRDLPALKTLRIAHTKVTDTGFKNSLAPKESLMQLDVQGTAISRETIQAWKSAKSGRRALQ